MPFSTLEISGQEGRPGLLFHFTRPGIDWRYTNLEEDIEFQTNNFESLPISMGPVIQSGTADSDNLEIILPAACELSEYLDLFTPSEEIVVYVRKTHLTENLDLTMAGPGAVLSEAPLFYVGSIHTVKRPSLSQRTLLCGALSESMSRGGLRLSWSRNCTHVLYGRGCNLNKDDFVENIGSITVVDAVSISGANFATFPAGYFSGGFIEWNPTVGVTERMGIERHNGGNVTLMGLTNGLTTGTLIVAYPGCDRLPTTCNDTFANLLNYGGINHMQGKSPFDGTPVF